MTPPALDAVRLTLGTLTVVPVRAPTLVDRRVAGAAMALAPLVGALLGSGAALAVWISGLVGWSPLIGAGLALTFLVVATGGLHLDGLADTVDGLAGGRSPEGALQIMRRGDIGPLGVCAVVVALLLQLGALDQAIGLGTSTGVCVLALTIGRLALPLACSTRVTASRPTGLGSAVAGTVGPVGLAVSTGAAAAVAGVVLLIADGPDAAQAALAVLAGLTVTMGALGYAVRRLGGITGDVLGALTELATTAALLTLVAAPHL